MTFSVLARLIAAALLDSEHDAVDFIWHGGETTLLSPKFYEKALYVQGQFQRRGQTVTNSIQTNATRITMDWVRLFRTYQFSVSLSLDGPREAHDLSRVYASGRGSFSDVLKGIDLLRENDVRFSVLMVVDESTLELGPERVFDFFLEHGIHDFGLIAAKPLNQPEAQFGTRVNHYVDPTRMTAFLARMYDLWVGHGDETVHIRDLDSIRRALQRNRPGLCTLAGSCLGKYFLVEPNGEIAHCDLFLGDPRYTLGNIMEQDFADFRRSHKLSQLQQENGLQLDALRQCSEFEICGGWCPHERYVSLRHNPYHRNDCCGLKPLITHIRNRMCQSQIDEQGTNMPVTAAN